MKHLVFLISPFFYVFLCDSLCFFSFNSQVVCPVSLLRRGAVEFCASVHWKMSSRIWREAELFCHRVLGGPGKPRDVLKFAEIIKNPLFRPPLV